MMRFKSQAVTGQQRHGAVAFPLVLVAEEPMAQQDLRAQSAVLVEQLRVLLVLIVVSSCCFLTISTTLPAE